MFELKRQGKDADPLFFTLGKIHGLEYLGFVDRAALLAANGNPVRIQKLINELSPRALPGASSRQELEAEHLRDLAAYKATVDKLSVYPSDRKKLMALPFYMRKRMEQPEPRHGQDELQLFEDASSRGWFEDSRTTFDEEKKITEFDFENFLSEELVARVDTSSEDFRDFVRALNFTSKTALEELEAKKEAFRSLMPVFAGLSPTEKRALLHLVKNKRGQQQPLGSEIVDDLLAATADTGLQQELAAVSERENFNAKNHFRLKKQQLQYIDKKRQPVEESSVRDLLRNQHLYRIKMQEEVPNYENLRNNSQFEHGLLNYLSEGSMGEMKELVKELGITRGAIPFYNMTQYRQYKDNMLHEGDTQFQYLQTALFTPLDMTDYETNFVGFNELPGAPPIMKQNYLQPLLEEVHPQTDSLASIEDPEEPIRYGTNQTMLGMVQDRYTEVEPEEMEFYGSEDGDEDEDYDEEGEEGEADYGDYGDYDEEDVEEWPPKDKLPTMPVDDRAFYAGETLRGKYADHEVEAFMKLLNVKPRA